MIREFGDDNAFPFPFSIPLNEGFRSELNHPPSGLIGGPDPFPAVYESTRGKVRTREVGHELFGCDLRMFKQGNDRINGFYKVMGGDVGRHSYGNSR